MNNEISENNMDAQDDATHGSTVQNGAVQDDAVKDDAVHSTQEQKVVIRKKKQLGEYTEYGSPDKRPTWIRVVCIVAVVLLVGLIIATLIAAIAGASKETIMALILCDGIIPIFIWVFLKITQRSLDRRKEAEKYYGQNQN